MNLTIVINKKFLALAFSCILCFFNFFSSCSPAKKITESELGTGWANNSVNTVIFRQNALTTFDDHQFTAYYDEESILVLAKRPINTDSWEVKKTEYKGNTKDAHNAISIAVDGKGFLHVSWDHHDTRLRYAVSTTPMGLELGEEQEMTGKEESKVAYPQFYNLEAGNLLFLYRSGQSGKGILIVNLYNLKNGIWTQIHHNLIDGEDQRNAYWQSFVDHHGNIHLSWVWRETWDVSTNHDIAYAVSRDNGLTWKKTSGEKYQLPITVKTAEYAWKVPENSSLINQTSITADAKGNPYVANYWNENGSTQYQIVYLNDGVWKKEDTGFRKSSFQLGGGGTKRIPISRPEILVDSEGNSTTTYLLFRDEERGNKISLAYKDLSNKGLWKIKDLTSYSVGEWEPNFDKELFRKKKKLHIFVQKVTQVDGEGLARDPATPIRILELNNLPN